MFEFTNVKITQSAKSGHNIRPRSGESIDLVVTDYDEISEFIDVGIYRIKLIQCDIFNESIVFVGEDDSAIATLSPLDGTMAIMNNLVISKIENLDTD